MSCTMKSPIYFIALTAKNGSLALEIEEFMRTNVLRILTFLAGSISAGLVVRPPSTTENIGGFTNDVMNHRKIFVVATAKRSFLTQDRRGTMKHAVLIIERTELVVTAGKFIIVDATREYTRKYANLRLRARI
ncbi:hypothetical protein PT974_12176 [Cladobotryum mycophilum]|uniref:Uncharacterized protein n=1 Tax=Cladobotryum mycophilum TaxID=491253 RepID=A0ABR0S8D1_9HYPO